MMAVLGARLARWWHQICRLYRPWSWRKVPPCAALEVISPGPPHADWTRTTYLGCTCGIHWYGEPTEWAKAQIDEGHDDEA